ncbi:MAG: DNA internalization-related competence protein ComEC/Rec2 [Anaeroplasma bactoclasticum]|nr:DNA internalization-related competence protein ComEC/Rec2 [Anaeroplasma bactoclasticum]
MKLRNKPFCNDLHFFLFAAVLLLLAIYYPPFWLLLGIYLIFIFKKTKYIVPIGVVLLIIFSSYLSSNSKFKEVEPGEYDGIFKVIDVQDKNVIIKGKSKYVIYEAQSQLLPGDIISARVRLYKLAEASFEGDFDAKKYYKSKGITNRAKILEYEVIQSDWSVARFRFQLLKHYESSLDEKSFSYLKTLFFGISDLDKEVKQAYSMLYISHLLSISGLHITFLYTVLVGIMEKFFHIKGEGISVSLIGIYVLFIGYPSSCVRAFFFLVLNLWNKKGAIQYTKLDIFSISFISMVILFPLRVFQSSFILSFLISFIYVFMEEFNPTSSKIKKVFFSSFICIFSILPFLINQTNQFSIVGIFISFVLTYLFGKFLLPVILILVIYPSKIYEIIFQKIDSILLLLTDFTFPITVPHLSILWMILYYILFVYILVCLIKGVKKYTILYVFIYLCIVLSLRWVNPFYRVTFIDVGQGDSILIELPYNQGNLLVDSYTNTVEYLQSIGITKLDYVILSHFDDDHMGTVDEVLKEFDVRMLLYSAYEEKNKIPNTIVPKMAVKSGDSFVVGNVNFQVFGPIRPTTDANSNSVVLKFTLDKYSFLLTGDMTIKEEEDLILEYGKKLDCDILKVGHHGSKTSSSEAFLKLVTPTISIVSVGENNIYQLPDAQIIDRLKKISEVYMTKDKGNISIRIRNQIQVRSYR